MATCPNGHDSTQDDFCDTCGSPIATAVAADTITCPQCKASNVTDAIFCESCAYNFTNGQPDIWAPPSNAATPAPASQTPPATLFPSKVSDASSASTSADTPDAASSPEPAALPQATTPPAAHAPNALTTTPPAARGTGQIKWVAELWIDSDWYELQGSPDQLPSAGLPDIVPLVGETNLIGRVSLSKQTFPEIDCDLDTGVSRSHARLTTDGTRWWVEDLDSANGTFVAPSGGPLPNMPIPRGKVELTTDQRVYVGAWTRIVVRQATAEEKSAFTA